MYQSEGEGIPSDQHLRIWGMLLQLIGTGTVWFDLTGTAREFGEKPLAKRAWDYLKSAFTGPAPVNGSAVIQLEAAELTAAGGTVTMTHGDQPVEARVAQLEKELNDLVNQISRVRGEIRTQKSELTAELKKQVAAMRTEVSSVHDRLKVSLVGNFSVLAFGVFWVVIGVILTSIPMEIVVWAEQLNLPDRF